MEEGSMVIGAPVCLEYIWIYQDCFWHRHDECRLSWQAFDIYQGYTFEFIKAVSDTVWDMINAAYRDKPLIVIRATHWSGLHLWVYQGCFWHSMRHDKCRLSWQAFDIYQGYTFEFIKAVSDTVWDMINAAYRDKPLIVIRATHWSGLHLWVYQGCFWHSMRHDKCRLSWQAFDSYQGYALIRATPLSLSRLFLTQYETW